ncbi:iminosuccinate reductase BhcD [Amphritea pacifica]|uniref:Ornithine cyclodeaminase family protein n=1 Tax=Amphritea pacifica TaxID=2811233 RepID=A0ABS2W8E6_9GAMM|nr:iminosuccinate reductase BhcD [Amphritea pacifica]MBN0987777.1 ornithine cyclodeaminase family protein [Amphritea pacifica]
MGGSIEELTSVNALPGISLVSEAVCQQVVGRPEAFSAVESVFAAMASGAAYNFPVVREAIGHADALYGFKSGFDRAGMVLGVKSGGYWPGNVHKNLTNHQSTVILFDPDTGQLRSLVGGNYLTAVRTAAASAVSIAHLARKDARVLGMVGAGHQSTFQLRAALEQRNFEKVVAWNPHPEYLSRLAAVCEELGVPFEAVEQEQLGAEADVIITITSAFEPLLMKDWIKPGTHIACMGTDTKGKQEVDPELLAVASVFTDEVAQSISIGEAQHAVASGLLSEADITPIGEVINGTHPGRRDDLEITLFDGTGVGLQDLAVASAAVELAQAKGLAGQVSL